MKKSNLNKPKRLPKTKAPKPGRAPNDTPQLVWDAERKKPILCNESIYLKKEEWLAELRPLADELDQILTERGLQKFGLVWDDWFKSGVHVEENPSIDPTAHAVFQIRRRFTSLSAESRPLTPRQPS